MAGVEKGRLDEGRFVVERKIGQGGMGSVYLAYDNTLGRYVAIKACYDDPIKIGESIEKVRRLEREAKFGGTLGAHPNIVTFHDSGMWKYEGKDHYAIVQEYLQGQMLSKPIEKLREEPLAKHVWSRYTLLQRFARACEGVAFAHENDVAHLDLKPENIFVLDEKDYRRAKVIDFGIAKLLSEEKETGIKRPMDRALAKIDTNITLGNYIVGTPAYMAPERAYGDKPEKTMDVWSLGVILYEMLSYRKPFESIDVEDLLSSFALGPRPINEKRHANADPVPEGLERITYKCLAQAPADRYRSAGELLEDLDGYLRSPKGVIELMPAAMRKKYEPGEVIVRKGEPSKAMYLLEKGMGNIVIEIGDIRKYRDEGLFGEAALVKPDQPRSATMRAGEAGCELVVIPDAASFARLVHESPQVAIEAIKTLHLRLVDMEEYRGKKPTK